MLQKSENQAFKLWEMGQLNIGKEPTKPAASAPKKEPLTPELSLLLENLRKQAFEKGLQEGYAAGMEKARISNEAIKEHFLTVAESFQNALKQADQTMAQDVLDLALDIAKAMIKTSLQTHPDKIIPVVQHCIRYLPYVEKPALLMLHPLDAEIVREQLREELNENHWQVIEDSNIERGGCMVETASNEIDATNQTRWRRITDALGRTNDWQVNIEPASMPASAHENSAE